MQTQEAHRHRQTQREGQTQTDTEGRAESTNMRRTSRQGQEDTSFYQLCKNKGGGGMEGDGRQIQLQFQS